MDSSGDGCKKTNIDASVGALVWVCRRNGSWWPGRIMGLDELSENCLVSPRSGTPVKLLGREDASVDWYNLEKSKRVKSFRCGEYNECIEKAKTSAANSSKKVVKYARRHDAILHALELESSHEGKEPLSFCTRTEKSGSETDGSARDSPVISHTGDDDEEVVEFDDASGSQETSNSVPELPQSGISFEEPYHKNASMVSVQGRRRKTPNDSEDDGIEGVKRMRGLEDLGMGVGSKTKVHAVGASELNKKNSIAPCNSNTSMHLEKETPKTGENYPSALKRKRSQVAKIHDFLKRKNRRRPLTKVLESTGMVSVPVICDQLPGTSSEHLYGLSDGRISGVECNRSKRSVTKMIGNSSNSDKVSEKASDGGCHLSNLSHMAKENGTARTKRCVAKMKGNNSNSSKVSEKASDNGCDLSNLSHKAKGNATSDFKLDENSSSDKLYDVPFVGDLDEENDNGLSPTFANCSSKKSQADALESQPRLHDQGEDLSGNEGVNESGSTSRHRAERSTSKWQLKGKRNSRHSSKSRKQVSRKHMDMDVEQDVNVAGKSDCNATSPASDNCILQKSRSVSEVREDGFQGLQKQKRGIAAEIKRSHFTVNSRYELTDFTGHNSCSATGLYDVKLEVKASYQPQNVPLVSLMSKLNGKAIVGHPLTIEVLSDRQCEKLLSYSQEDLQAELHQVPSIMYSTLQSRVSSKKSKGKKSTFYKKTRTLSSLTGHKQSKEDKEAVVEKSKGPFIACLPLKVVFSRINDAVNGLTRATQLFSPATIS